MPLELGDETIDVGALVSYAEATRRLLQLSAATIPLQALKTAVPFTSSVLLGHIDLDTRNAAALINTFIDFTYCILNSPLNLTSNFLYGALKAIEQRERVGATVQGALLFSLMLSAPQVILLCFSQPILRLFGQNEAVTGIVQAFFNRYVIGVPLLSLQVVTEQLALATKKLAIPPGAQALSYAAFFLSAYPLAFGKWSAPRLQSEGVADAFLARAGAAILFSLIVIMALSRNGGAYEPYRIFRYEHAKHFPTIKSTMGLLITYGKILLFMNLSELGNLYVLNMLIGAADKNNLSAQLVVAQYIDFLLIFAAGLGTAVQNLIAEDMERGKRNIFRYASLGLSASLLCPLVYGGVALLSPRSVMKPFLDPDVAENSPVVDILTTQYLLLVSVFINLSVAVRYVSTFALMGMGEMGWAFYGSMVTTWVGIPIGVLLAKYSNLNSSISYNTGLTAGLCLSMCLQMLNLSLKMNRHGSAARFAGEQHEGCPKWLSFWKKKSESGEAQHLIINASEPPHRDSTIGSPQA